MSGGTLQPTLSTPTADGDGTPTDVLGDAPVPLVAPRPEFVNVPDRLNRLGGTVWREAVAELLASREVLWRMSRREVVSRYRQSLLGLGWSVITPLVLLGVFVFLNNSELMTVGRTTAPYPLFLVVGLVHWQAFAGCVGRGTQSLAASVQLVQRVRCSREVLVLAKMAGAVFDYGIGLALVGLFLIGFGRVPAWTIVLLPAVFLVQLAFSIGLSLVLSVLNAALRDVASVVPLALNAWMFLTPVLYPASHEGRRAVLNWLNPMAPLVVTYRDLAFLGELSMPGQLACSAIVSCLVLVLGWRFFHSMLPHVVEKA